MKLHYNQLKLIRHLIRFRILDYESCLKVLDTENTGEMIAMSYAFRPLTKNKYISKNKDGVVGILLKGREILPEEFPLLSVGGTEQSKQRVLQVSRVAALMERNGVAITGELPVKRAPHFIPSACWRAIAPGILSTTRFVGMLLAYDRKYAVYDIEDGSMEWQVRAESSLFYTRYGSYETKADGMILICDDDKRDTIAENIIRQTMWNRKSLLNDHYTERDKPVRFSRSPIKLRTQYEHVYLTTPTRLAQSLKVIYRDEYIITHTVEQGVRLRDPKQGDIENWPTRFFLNPAYDLLRLVYFFSAVKRINELALKSSFGAPSVDYAIIMQRRDLPILRMYPDVVDSERVEVYEFGFSENTETH